MKIEFLYSEDCPSHPQALARLRNVLEQLGVRSEVLVREVGTIEQARELLFYGSPTIRIDGVDVDPQGLEGESPGLGCRIYRREDGRFSPLPTESFLRGAVESILEGEDYH